MQKTVLIIEDEQDIREAMADALEAAGYDVATADNGKSGLQMAIQNQPDLILLDLMMPVMGGHEVLEELRKDPWGNKAKVVILSAMDDVTNIASAHEGGITDYIIKSSSSLEEIVNKVRLAMHVG